MIGSGCQSPIEYRCGKTLPSEPPMFRFTIRDVLWLMIAVGLGVCLWLEHSRRANLEWSLDRLASVLSAERIRLKVDGATITVGTNHGTEWVIDRKTSR